ncbi:hypothetical protein [Actinomadura sp. 6K520]|uniref:ATP-binding protein n=1 Tax=Actinomadura sp. 6K520 TaxID=2530364 RepID=UPI00104A4F27|nr:hypothetical protein [Actinomadura sp. 6K520]TDE29063.1 hypothetical protein E1289_20700 [Actinomadura sp. 6K520]
MTETAAARGIPWRLENGGCAALPLPGDETIAAVARAHVAGLLPALGLSGENVDDVTLMVSELATNVLDHATPGEGARSAELWVYRRSDGRGHDELVVKAFDTLREWRGHPGGPGRMRERGRGLEIIDILTEGRWGHHPTRSRLSSPAARGKATWFALPIPRTRIARGRRHVRTPNGPAQAAKVLHTLLVQRGIDRFSLGHEPGASVLTCDDLSVRCEDETFRWHARAGEAGELPVTDITEVGEQIVRLCEAMDDVHVV